MWIASIGERPERAVRSDLLREFTTFAAGIGAHRIVVESCSQDKQDLAAITGALAAIGTIDRVRAAIESPRNHDCCGRPAVVRQLVTDAG